MFDMLNVFKVVVIIWVVVLNRIEVDDNNIEGLIINDEVYNYVINVIKYGFLRKIFILVIRSGDGIC